MREGKKKKKSVQIDREGMEISVGAKTGRIYVRDPTKCSKIGGVNSQCQLNPVPGSKMCQKHIDVGKKCQMLHQLRKNNNKSACQIQDKAHKRCTNSGLKGIHSVLRGIHSVKFIDLNNKNKLDPTKLWRQKLGQPEVGNPIEAHKLQPLTRPPVFNGYPISMHGVQRGANGHGLERKLYNERVVCDEMYKNRLEGNKQPSPKSWIQHQHNKDAHL